MNLEFLRRAGKTSVLLCLLAGIVLWMEGTLWGFLAGGLWLALGVYYYYDKDIQ